MSAVRATPVTQFPEPVQGFGEFFVKQYHDFTKHRAAIIRTCGSSAYIVLDVLREYSHGYGQAVTRRPFSAQELADACALSLNTAITALRKLQAAHIIASSAGRLRDPGGRTWRLCPPAEWVLKESTPPNIGGVDDGQTPPNIGVVAPPNIGVVARATPPNIGVASPIERNTDHKPSKDTTPELVTIPRARASQAPAGGPASATRAATPETPAISIPPSAPPGTGPEHVRVVERLRMAPGWRASDKRDYAAVVTDLCATHNLHPHWLLKQAGTYALQDKGQRTPAGFVNWCTSAWGMEKYRVWDDEQRRLAGERRQAADAEQRERDRRAGKPVAEPCPPALQRQLLAAVKREQEERALAAKGGRK